MPKEKLPEQKPRTLKSFECRIEDYYGGQDLVSTHIGTSASQARYAFFREQELSDSWKYSEAYKWIKSRSLGVVKPHHFFTDQHNFERMIEYRNIPFAFQGMIIEVDGKKGWIVGSNGSMNLEVLFEGENHTNNCHPTWKTTYYDNKMNIIKQFIES